MATKPAVTSLFGIVRTINTLAAKEMLRYAESFAPKIGEEGVSGFAVVYSRTGMQEASLTVGDRATPLNVAVALDKIKTVLATRRSTTVQRERMELKKQNRDDFAGQLGSLFGGGIAIFRDGEFVGAFAFSGGTQEQDDEIGVRSVLSCGFETDLDL